ncbi:MAG: DUF4387 domain-containing protein [Burkholderiaceae bacterium]
MTSAADRPEVRKRLRDVAPVVRSKNAGPTQLTIDIFFADAAGYTLAAHSASLTPSAVAALYGQSVAQMRRFLLPEIFAMKFSMPRQIVAGSPGDGDVYGAQQHAPLLDVELDPALDSQVDAHAGAKS